MARRPTSPLRRALRIGAAVLAALGLLAAAAFLAATTPLDRSPILGTRSATQTLDEIRALSRTRAARASVGPLRAGWAHRDITPPIGTPTLGYGARRGAGTRAVADGLEVRALALAVGDGDPIVVLSADLCLWTSALSGAIAATVADVVPRARLYIGATHTHNGPSAFVRSRAVEWSMGAYDPDVFGLLVARSAEAVRAALAARSPADYRTLSIDAAAFVTNRSKPGTPLLDEMRVLEFRRDSGERHALVTFSAHATAIGPGLLETSGDYPGALIRRLRDRGYADASFLAGPTGQAAPRIDGRMVHDDTPDGARTVGETLADAVVHASSTSPSPWNDRVTLGVLRSEVALPAWRARLGSRALRPALADWLIGQRPLAHVHALRIDDTIWVGHSFEFSAVIARGLVEAAQSAGISLAITSLNGDHAFYVVPEEDFDLPVYESGMTFFGPGLGPYLARATEQTWRAVVDARTRP